MNEPEKYLRESVNRVLKESRLNIEESEKRVGKG